MPNWILKAAVQKAISFLPYKEDINFFFQKHVTRGVDLDDTHFGYKLAAARDHIRYYQKYCTVPPAAATVLELGTGWYPIVPTLLHLAGFDRIVTIDIRDWTSKERQLTAIRRILDYHDKGQLKEYLEKVDSQRLADLRAVAEQPENHTVATLHAAIRTEARIMDATRLDAADRTFDFICSNNTFEHIYAPTLRDILREFKRVLKPGGVMSHFIDLSDHFAHLDPGITIYNFLRFTERQWAAIDNSIQPQNRLRWRDYVAMYQELGIPIREEEVVGGDAGALATVPVAEQYRGYTTAELAISHGSIIS
ncbi:methyltransferase domain-containing protein [Neolewinella sp.]|uniref:methyltransferase domain-containing protein n=1 Tax=Neolewinella sp. TaxID=2993543 RepID=UPI003B529EE0